MKIRVPKWHRPPSRWDAFKDPVPEAYGPYSGKFRCTGAYRNPKPGEYYWGIVFPRVRLCCDETIGLGMLDQRVILESIVETPQG